MRVGVVCPYSLSLPGGVQGQALGLARALRGMGVEARVLAPCDGPPPDPAVTPLGNSIPTAANGSMAAIAPDPSATLRTIRALRDEAFDVVHLHEPLVPGPTMSALVFAESPLLGTFHRSGESAIYRVVRPLARWAAGRLAMRTAVSESALETARTALGGSYELLWNGIDVARYDGATPWPLRPPEESRTRVLFVGRHEPRKGLSVLLEALGHLGDGFHLWVAGEGPETAGMRHATAADHRIEWLGTIDDAEKVARMRAADILCAPSLGGESFGVVLLEGMAASAVVVASDLPGYRNVARRGEDALLVPPGDPSALAAALRKAAAAGPEVEEMVRSGRRRAALFSIDSLAERYLDLYTCLAPSSGIPRRGGGLP